MEAETNGSNNVRGGKGKAKVKRDLYQEVTDSIIKALEDGVANPKGWQCPWNKGGEAVNHTTDRAYSGINTLLLAVAMMQGGFRYNRWMTYKQGQGLGGQVRKGEKSTQVVYYNFVKKKDADDDDRKSYIPILRSWNVFNISQFDGIEYSEPSPSELQRFSQADAFIENCGADISFGGDRACYIPSLDKIMLPVFDNFKHSEGYYSTAFHELSHWTGHPKRLNRELSGRFGSESYAMEELIAELASAYLCNEFSIEGEIQHIDYLANWLTVLRNDKYAIFTASKHAEQAAKFLKGEEDTDEDGEE
jgi:antirestriction protein ArdC